MATEKMFELHNALRTILEYGQPDSGLQIYSIYMNPDYVNKTATMELHVEANDFINTFKEWERTANKGMFPHRLIATIGAIEYYALCSEAEYEKAKEIRDEK